MSEQGRQPVKRTTTTTTTRPAAARTTSAARTPGTVRTSSGTVRTSSGAVRASSGTVRTSTGAARTSAGAVRTSAVRTTAGTAHRPATTTRPGTARTSAPVRTVRSTQPIRKPEQKIDKQTMLGFAVIAVLVIVLLVLIISILGRLFRGGSDTVAPQTAPTPTVQVMIDYSTPEPTSAPTPTAIPQTEYSYRTAYIPEAADGFLPVFYSAPTDEKIIAITIDDCYQGENLQKIVDLAIQYGGKLTLFPIGENAIRSQQSQTIKYAWENGFEIENHTYDHNGLYGITDDELAWQMYGQSVCINKVLGVNYQQHFIRPKGGDARNDQRIHAYAMQMGIGGVAHWSVTGSVTDLDEVMRDLKSGDILLFHTTDNDLARLQQFIPFAASQGYQMVTLNEMFGLPANEYTPLTEEPDPKNFTAPPLEPFDRVLVPIRKTTYSSGAKLLQQRLIDLGYLGGEADGIFGKGSANALKEFQYAAGFENDGVASVELQEFIYSDEALKYKK